MAAGTKACVSDLRAAVFVLLVCAARAAAQDTTRAIPVDTLTVSVARAATMLARVPAAVSVITAERIQAGRLTIGLDEALAEVPGLLINNRYNYALGTRISMRGFGARAAFGVRGLRISADGIPLTMADGQSNLNNVDLTSAGRIEVLRGAAALLYGNAAGGVIDIRSELPAPGFQAEARALAADMGSRSLANTRKVNIKAGGGSAATRYLVSGAHLNTRGFREHARFEQNNLNVHVEHARDATRRSAFTLSLADAPRAENPGSLPRDSAQLHPQMAWPRNIATDAHERSRQLQLGVRHERQLGGAALTASVYGLTRTLHNPLPFAYIDLQRIAGGVRSTLAWPHLLLGVDADALSDARAEYDNDGGRRGSLQSRDQTDRITSFGPFVRVSVDLARRLNFSGGLRYDRSHFEVADHYLADGRDDSGSRTMSAFSPGAGLLYTAAQGVVLFGNVGTSFQTPTTTEMINTPPAPGAACCAAGFNPLQPERALSYEVGVRTHWHERISLEAALFHARIRHELVPFRVASAGGRDFFRNAGRTRHRGVELATAARVSRALRLTASYTYSDFVFEDDGSDATAYEGNRLPGIPPHHLFTTATIGSGVLVAEPELEWTASYFADDGNTDAARNGAFTIVNLRLRSQQSLAHDVMPFAAINNIFDVRYNASVVINAAGNRYFEPAPGRSFYLGVAVRMGREGRPE